MTKKKKGAKRYNTFDDVVEIFAKAVPKSVARAALSGDVRTTLAALCVEHSGEARKAYAVAARLGNVDSLLGALESRYKLEGSVELFDGRPVKLSEVLSFKMSNDFAKDIIRAAIPQEVVEHCYAGENGCASVSELLLSSPFGEQVLNKLSRGRTKGEHIVNDALNELYAPLEERFFEETGVRVSPIEALKGKTREYRVKEKVRRRFLAGEDLTNRGLNADDGALWHALRVHDPKVRISGTEGSYTHKVCTLVGDGLTTDAILSTSAGRKFVGTIGERELDLLLIAVAQYDPNLKKFPSLKRFFEPPIREVVYGGTEREVTNSFGERFFADGRIITDEEDILVEAKTGSLLYSKHLIKDLMRYEENNPSWADGEPITSMLLLLNSRQPRVKNYAASIRQGDWGVITGDEFASHYEAGLGLLADHHPEIFDKFPIHLLTEINDLVSGKPYLLAARPMAFCGKWMVDLLDKVKMLSVGDEKTPLVKSRKIRSRYVSRMDELVEVYGSNRSKVVIPDTVYFDIEATGFRNTGASTIVVGLAYEKDGKMIIDQHVARTPLEERAVWEKTLKTFEGFDRLVTFNGKTYDVGFAQERCFANRLLPNGSIPSRHDDLYENFKKYAARHHRRASLQTFESGTLGVSRSHDLNPGTYEKVYADYLLGNSSGSLITKIVEHNRLDLATLALMDSFFKGKLPK